MKISKRYFNIFYGKKGTEENWHFYRFKIEKINIYGYILFQIFLPKCLVLLDCGEFD